MTNGLFKYFQNHEDKLERFTNGQVYLTPPKYFNDPWDFLMRAEPPTEEELGSMVPFLHPGIMPEFRTRMSTPQSLEEEARVLREQVSEVFGIVCLTQQPLGRLMWAHYGGSHRGFVAEFRCGEVKSESGLPLRDSPFGQAVKVRYQRKPLLKRDTSNMAELCLTKHSCWKYEQEWRVLWPLSNAERHPKHQGYVLRPFKPTDLLRVILGLNSHPNVKSQLRQMLNDNQFEHVRKEEVYIDPNSGRLKPRLLSW